MAEPTDHHSPQEWLACLQANGYRLTEPRKAVVETIAESDYVLTPQDVYDRARSRYPKLGLVTVYRTIEKLEELELIQRVHRPSGCQAFIAAFAGHQHLLICKNCGRVEFFSGDQTGMETLMDSVRDRSGYQIHEHWLQLFGVCALCRDADSSRAHRP